MSSVGFLDRCRKSSAEAYEAFKTLLAELEQPATRAPAMAFLHHEILPLVQKHSAAVMTEQFHFSLAQLTLQLGEGEPTRLTLLQLPSTFAPEEWSFTFFEGLTRFKPAEFHDRKVAELGCGVGWISLALAMQARPSKVYGLDINPRAVTCSRINLYLNAFDANGLPTWMHEGRTLADVVEFHVSDLLEYCRGKGVVLDRVIGCIPQVLNPDPEFTARMLGGAVQEHESDEFLVSLSNYAPQQGYLEDQFGLGLIARAVEESVDVLRGSGKLILNLGGRPGQAVLKRLFLRRGFDVREVWTTRVSQAKDTDIRSLVAIEERSAHRFEFFVESASAEPVSARTALAFAEGGGEIAHALSVYEATLRDPLHVPRVLRLLRKPGYEDARRAIDLSYAEDELAQEKLSFLAALADRLDDAAFFPYGSTAGLSDFRRHLAAFFGSYLEMSYEESCFVVAPSTAALARGLLALYRPEVALMDSQLAHQLGAPLRAGVLEIPRSADLVCEMMERLKPRLVIYSMPVAEAYTRDAFTRVIETARKCGTRVFVDISELLDLSSTPQLHGVFRYLARERIPAHAALLCGLVKNRLYQDLQTCFLISENQDLLDGLASTAELTYSRTPTLSQLYYDRILSELLSFQIAGGGSQGLRTPRREDAAFAHAFVPVCADARAAFEHPAITGERLARQSSEYLRLDYGENCLPAPASLKQGLFEAFSMLRVPAEDADPTPELLEWTRRRMGLAAPETGWAVSLGGGVAPLFAAIAEDSARAGRTLVFPAGAYGYFVAASRFFGARVEIAETREQDEFKLTPASLEAALKRAGQGAWVVLSAPVVNPTGAVYTGAELTALLGVARKHGSLVVLDSIFSGLEFTASDAVQGFAPSGARWGLLGGLSKEFAAGGLRVGYGITSDPELIGAWRRAQLAPPHSTLQFALKRAYAALLREDSGVALELEAQRDRLADRSRRLSTELTQQGWRVLAPHGGLFLTATPTALIGRKAGKETISMANVADVLRTSTGIVINTPGWTGIPGYFRFVLSVEDDVFETALKRLVAFHGGLQ